MQHHAERMARLKQLMKQLDQMHLQVAEVARQVAEMRAQTRTAVRPVKRRSAAKRRTGQKGPKKAR